MAGEQYPREVLPPQHVREILELRQQIDQLFQQSDLETVRMLTLFLIQIRQERSGE